MSDLTSERGRVDGDEGVHVRMDCWCGNGSRCAQAGSGLTGATQRRAYAPQAQCNQTPQHKHLVLIRLQTTGFAGFGYSVSGFHFAGLTVISGHHHRHMACGLWTENAAASTFQRYGKWAVD